MAVSHGVPVQNRRVGRACLFAGGTATVLMGGYHLILPVHMQWADAMAGVPGMVTWGLFAINFDLSLMMLLMGTWTALVALSSARQLAAALIPAMFWTAHAAYLRVELMPIPNSMLALRLTLEGFTLGVVALHWVGVVGVLRSPEGLRPPRVFVAFVGGGGALAAMGAVLAAVFLSMPTLKPENTNARPPSSAPDVDVARATPTVADSLGVPPLSELSRAGQVSRVTQGTTVTPEQYTGAWPELAPLLIEDGSEMSAETLRTIEGTGTLNLLAQRLRRDGSLDEAREVIESALEREPNHPLHHLQSAYCYLDRLATTDSPLARWSIANRAQQAFELALASDPTLSDARYYVAFACERAPVGFGGDRDRSMALITDAIEAGQHKFLAVRAQFHFARGDEEAGVDDALAAIDTGYTHDGMLVSAITELRRAGRAVEAARLAAIAVRVESTNAISWLAYARSLDPTKDRYSIAAALKHAAELEPENEIVQRALEADSR